MDDLRAALKALPPALQYSAGFDFARVADLSVLDLLAIEKNLKRREALVIEMRGVPGDEQKAIVREVLSAVQDRLIGAAFDATGMGWTVAEDMGRIFGLRESEDSTGIIWPIKFTEDWYRLHMPPLKAAFEDDAISIARDAEHLSDLRAVKVVRGTPRVPPAREGEKGKRRHGDYAIALALAHFASRMRWVEYAYRAAGPRGSATDGIFEMLPRHDDAPVRDWWQPPMGAKLGGWV
jgi:phage FluMu gp28-like protein